MSKFKDNIPGFPGYHVTKNGGRRKAQYYEKRYVKYYCMRCGKKRYENKENRNSKR